MRVLLAQDMLCLPAWGGANKSNQLILEDLTKRGHTCRVVARACGIHPCLSAETFYLELAKRGISFETAGPGAEIFSLNGVRVAAVTERGKLGLWLRREIADFDPDWIIVASEDFGQILLQTALRVRPSRVVYLARTTNNLPFGPGSPYHSPGRTELLRQVPAIVVISRYLKDYLKQWADLNSIELPMCPNGPGPFPNFGHFDKGFVTIVNPCAYKGVCIFLSLAQAFPGVAFAAVPTWGTTEQDICRLRELPNVSLLAPSDDIDEILRLSRAVLVPSLWAEAKANIITEAMIRGIPVLASDVGGNYEAKLDVDYLLPVSPIRTFLNEVDDRVLPVAIIPEQDTGPWVAALGDLLAHRSSYERVSLASRTAALIANERQTVGPFEDYLMHLSPRGISPTTNRLN